MKANGLLNRIFYGVIVRPILLVLLGFNARNLDRLSASGPRIIAANHNSHLDAMVLMSLFKLSDLKHVKVVAAKDYFCRNCLMTWFSMNIIGIIPIDRAGKTANPVKPIINALDANFTVILFPEGTRGDPELLTDLKYGISMIAKARPEVPITPVYMHGLGKSLPRGTALPVPFICDINVGLPIHWQGNRKGLIDDLQHGLDGLKEEMEIKPWV